ncbi:unnamed protein product [Acanthoscelides obtectus]|uniref:Uncharacterized protein n=1 Tax=Acanthoscelides obtectus TaxID=200917 RepID=A0A9P0Q1P0_ACAOB|nr:unnamed protein product [Acanthoscelides obtectus]CAK1630525.1 hypothetical protein AOBTE_LOCUS6381 [Acanthoscelides obtectus]
MEEKRNSPAHAKQVVALTMTKIHVEKSYVNEKGFMAVRKNIKNKGSDIKVVCKFIHNLHDNTTQPLIMQEVNRHDSKMDLGDEKIPQSPLHHVEIVSNLKDNFKNRFKDFNEIPIVAQFVVSPFMEIDIQQFATSVTQNFSEDIAATETEVRFLEAVSRCEVLSFHIILHIHFLYYYILYGNTEHKT